MDLKNYPITSQFGEIDNVHSQPHSGVDIGTKTGTKIYSRDSGVVSITVDQWLGNTVRLKLDNGMVVVYGHLSKINVSDGQYIGVGECLAETGGAVGSKNSGLTTGEHCHISLYNSSGQLIDPTDYLFNHSQIQNDSGLLMFPMMVILILFIAYKLRRFLFYGLGLFAVVGIILFLAS